MRQEIQFDLQDYLEARFSEVHTRFNTLDEKMDSTEKRLNDVEHTHRTLKWIGGTFIAGLVAMLFDMVTNHIPNMVREWFRA